ncbi:hypothetical protein SAMN04490248_102184 [Salinihabitans flavidus]|uniref:Oxidoreductase molybdopterin-binding domain-containing protein n=1 Tax=Salinihabitans flavidus TaxID=569882 RepID=A0A1H8MP22_9RHOB|nr:hypothetical protein [Salinihabitans flavidus]SEO19087.1 hypothetical protein SAMN04490248_102184 [Salinihabitans flavidus]
MLTTPDRTFRRLLYAPLVGAILVQGAPLHADGAEGAPILTVTGQIDPPDTDLPVTFDLEALRALPTRRVETTTIWSEGVQRFDGVGLDVLAQEMGATGRAVRASAVNDYSVTIPMADATPDGPIVAYLRNGKTMSLRDKGPLWIIYPYDSDTRYQTEVVYSRSIWQLDRLDFVD